MTTPERSRGFTITLALWILLGPCLTTGAQQSSKVEPAPAKETLNPEEKKRADLRADTEKLYKLTQELKEEVAKSNKDTLSVPVVKKAQEIERLAKSIKERSRTP